METNPFDFSRIAELESFAHLDGERDSALGRAGTDALRSALYRQQAGGASQRKTTSHPGDQRQPDHGPEDSAAARFESVLAMHNYEPERYAAIGSAARDERFEWSTSVRSYLHELYALDLTGLTI